jgi:hypothetical protein
VVRYSRRAYLGLVRLSGLSITALSFLRLCHTRRGEGCGANSRGWSAGILLIGSYRVFCWPPHTKSNAQGHAGERLLCWGANPLPT